MSGARAIAFQMPGGEVSAPSRPRPIDMAHLARQTLGDRGVEQEVLALFVQQALVVRDRIVRALPGERVQLAHALRGSAAGVGAFAIADCAAVIEGDPLDMLGIRRLAALIDEARSFIAAISR
jgi:HPt (histidine-containing phosphotransfer) domain-containing protein